MATIIIPTPLRKYTDQNRRFKTRQNTLSGAIQQFVEEYPEVKQNLLDENGNIRSYIKLYIGDEEVHPNKNGSLKLSEDTEVSIIPAIAGGASSPGEPASLRVLILCVLAPLREVDRFIL